MWFIPFPSNSCGKPGYSKVTQTGCVFITIKEEKIEGKKVGSLQCAGDLNTPIDVFDGDEVFGGTNSQPGFFCCFQLDGENVVHSGSNLTEIAHEVQKTFTDCGYNVVVTV